MFRSVAKNFSILTTATIIEAAITFLFIAFVARQFGPALFGKYIFINVSVTIATAIINAGVIPIAFREIARHRDDPDQLFNDIFSLRILLGMIGYLSLVLIVYLTSDDPEYLTLISIAGLAILIESFNGSYRAYYTAYERMAIPSAFSVSAAGLSALAGVLLLLQGHSLFTLIVSNVVMTLLVSLAWTYGFRRRELKYRFEIRPAAWKRLMALIIPFAPIHAANQVNRVLNLFMLGKVSGPLPTDQAVGFYSPANSVTNTIVKLVTGLRRALIPPIAVKLNQGKSVDREIDLILKIVIVIFCLPLILGTAYMSGEIIHILFGDQYQQSVMVLVLLGWAGAIQLASLVPESFLFSHPEHRMQDYIAGPLASVGVNAALCLLLIGEYGILGAAAAAILGRLVYFLFIAYYYRRQLSRNALSLKKFWDVGLVYLASFGIWHQAFAHIENHWLAMSLSALLTLILMGVFFLSFRSRMLRT